MRGQSGSLGASYVCCFWGDRTELDRFLQRYAIEAAKIEARRHGHQATETQLADGWVRLSVQIGGAA
jgi:hypothetical protein